MEPVRQPAPTRSNKTSKPVNKPPSKPVVKPSPRQPEEDKSGISPEDFLPVTTQSFVIHVSSVKIRVLLSFYLYPSFVCKIILRYRNVNFWVHFLLTF